MPFDHEKLDVYHAAIDFIARANTIIEQLPRGRGYLTDQLQRASLSIVLNIAEGAGKYSAADKGVFYVRAKASAMESAAVLDVCAKLQLTPIAVIAENKSLLSRIVQMLTKLIKSRHSRSPEPERVLVPVPASLPVPVPVPEPGF
ncbi:MAG TPA: four helix bundle protein [Thermoanaerobaculia bacterium]|nr:four helix bundle protein [Thermoanaerobaculia bacterium]